mmetsp:Transcript_120941/g.342113  ORF Transcript_120941/g.342113 Transcript_120941/m.342113 type:complete len:229 (+) Transcript_120941:1931-2617(+)
MNYSQLDPGNMIQGSTCSSMGTAMRSGSRQRARSPNHSEARNPRPQARAAIHSRQWQVAHGRGLVATVDPRLRDAYLPMPLTIHLLRRCPMPRPMPRARAWRHSAAPPPPSLMGSRKSFEPAPERSSHLPSASGSRMPAATDSLQAAKRLESALIAVAVCSMRAGPTGRRTRRKFWGISCARVCRTPRRRRAQPSSCNSFHAQPIGDPGQGSRHHRRRWLSRATCDME